LTNDNVILIQGIFKSYGWNDPGLLAGIWKRTIVDITYSSKLDFKQSRLPCEIRYSTLNW
jgi:hypothetical protein